MSPWPIVCAAAGAAWLSATTAAGELPFATAKAEQRTVPTEMAFDAVLEAVNQSTVAAQTAGRIAEVRFDVNDFVPKDQVLVRIDETTQRAQRESIEADVAEAQARYNEADSEHSRIREVYQKKLVAKSEYDSAAANLKAAAARLESARARLKRAQEEVAYTLVKAPFAGYVTKRHVQLGEAVGIGQPLMSGFSLEDLRAVANVPQGLAVALQGRTRARVLVNDHPKGEFEVARVTFFPFADQMSHTFTVRAELPPGQQGLFPGMFAKVVFDVGEEQRLLVPATAVAYRSEVSAVYVVRPDSRVIMRQVRVGRVRGEGMMEVLAGLDAGEVVALDPVRAGVYVKEQQTAGEGAAHHGGEGKP